MTSESFYTFVKLNAAVLGSFDKDKLFPAAPHNFRKLLKHLSGISGQKSATAVSRIVPAHHALSLKHTPRLAHKQHTPHSRLTAVLFTTWALMDGKGLFAHTHLNTQGMQLVWTLNTKSNQLVIKTTQAVHMLHNTPSPQKNPQKWSFQSVLSRCGRIHSIQIVIVPFLFLLCYSGKNSYIKSSTLTYFCVNT